MPPRPPMMTSLGPRGQHDRGAVVRLVEWLRNDAARAARNVFGRRWPKRANNVPGLHRTSWSRAANGCTSNPAYRLALWFVGLRIAGRDRTGAEQLLVWLGSVVDALWPETDADVRELARAELAEEAEGAVHRLAYMTGDVAAGPEWLAALQREEARQRQLISALAREVRERTERRAA